MCPATGLIPAVKLFRSGTFRGRTLLLPVPRRYGFRKLLRINHKSPGNKRNTTYGYKFCD